MRPKNFIGTNPLTPEEAAALASDITDDMPAESAQLLLLCHAFTYEPDESEREYMMRAIEARLGPFLPGFDRMQAAAMTRELEALRTRRGK